MKNVYVIAAVVTILVIVIGAIAGVYISSRSTSTTTSPMNTSSSATSMSTSSNTTSASSNSKPIQVVAAENFWGSLVSQLGGTHVNVTSIVSNPNTDPHEYEANPSNAIAIANAKLVIVNGAGYDTWALDLIAASNTPGQVVLNVQKLISQSMGANPHFWYSPYYVNDTVKAMYNDLVSIDLGDKAYYTQQYAALNASLWSSYMSYEVQIKQEYAGAPVASTESIFIYMANATGLDVVSPVGFMEAVSEGNDPSAQDTATMEQLMEGGNSTVHVLVYNEQTVTPLTQTIKALAAQYEIPTVGVTETIQPPSVSFQVWMGAELIALQDALNAQALGQ